MRPRCEKRKGTATQYNLRRHNLEEMSPAEWSYYKKPSTLFLPSRLHKFSSVVVSSSNHFLVVLVFLKPSQLTCSYFAFPTSLGAVSIDRLLESLPVSTPSLFTSAPSVIHNLFYSHSTPLSQILVHATLSSRSRPLFLSLHH